MKTLYAPSPWKATINCTSLITAIVDGVEVEIATVDDPDDARLIAAAPELLESLRHMVAHTEGARSFLTREEKLAYAYAAIAKATGKGEG